MLWYNLIGQIAEILDVGIEKVFLRSLAILIAACSHRARTQCRGVQVGCFTSRLRPLLTGRRTGGSSPLGFDIRNIDFQG
ncbi:hypothetical protein D3C71_1708230 [compost metagenome]